MNGTNIEIAICDAYFNGATVYPDAFSDVDLASTYREILRRCSAWIATTSFMPRVSTSAKISF